MSLEMSTDAAVGRTGSGRHAASRPDRRLLRSGSSERFIWATLLRGSGSLSRESSRRAARQAVSVAPNNETIAMNSKICLRGRGKPAATDPDKIDATMSMITPSPA